MTQSQILSAWGVFFLLCLYEKGQLKGMDEGGDDCLEFDSNNSISCYLPFFLPGCDVDDENRKSQQPDAAERAVMGEIEDGKLTIQKNECLFIISHQLFQRTCTSILG